MGHIPSTIGKHRQSGAGVYEAARKRPNSVITGKELNVKVVDINASEPEVATAQRCPGSRRYKLMPRDIEPGLVDPDDYAPRCRLYMTTTGLQGTPERVSG